MKRVLTSLGGWLIACITVLLRLTMRRRTVDDPRPELRRQGTRYVMAALHAHQAACVFFNDENNLAALVSRSADGDLLVPSLRARGVRPIRGSSMKNGRDKGGARALVAMAKHVNSGAPAIITVDGPRGPRGTVNPGIVKLAERSDATILPVVCIASRRSILTRTWDQMQIPWPFSTLSLCFGPPVKVIEDPSAVATLTESLRKLEAQHEATLHDRRR